MKNKKFSIITICYNEPNLEETCKSIVNQTFQDFEWIVIDAGSNNETLAIFDKYKERIDYFVSESDNGRYNGMNKGIKVARGEYLNFMNAGDCFYSVDNLEKVNEVITETSNGDVFYGNGYFINVNSKIKIEAIMPKQIDEIFLFGTSLLHQAMFFKAELFEKYGYYDENYKIISDWTNYFVLFKKNLSFFHINDFIAIDDLSGISNIQKDLTRDERQHFLDMIYDQDEQKNLDIEYKKLYKKMLFEQFRKKVR